MSHGDLLLLKILAVVASGCSVIGGIFKAGVWVGALMVILIIMAILFIVAKTRS